VRQSSPLDLLAFNVKLLGQRTQKNALVSAGKIADKQRMLPSIRKLRDFNISIFATPGTSRFFDENGVPNSVINKIADEVEPNILSFLNEEKLDLVINVLTGDHDYDEASDVNLIRKLAIEGGIPLITDVDVAIATIEQLVTDHEERRFHYKIADDSQPWNLHLHFLDLVAERGGFACHHAHFDKAYLISPENLRLSQVDMQQKWKLYKFLKENYTEDDLTERISRGVEKMISQGVTYCRTMVDADSTVKLLPVKAAMQVKKMFEDQITLDIGVQPLQGVIEPASRQFFEEACEIADFVGGLPSRDRPTPEKHLDVIMEIARDLNKPLDVHVDQENNPLEDETELLALKTIEHGLEGKVFAVHAISVSAKSEKEQNRIVRKVKEAGVNVVICPSAALSMKQLAMEAPLHNSIAPFVKFLEAEVPVYLGVDNIHDLFMPMVDGDMLFESRLLMEACRFYDLDRVADIACARYAVPVSV
jgi:hypothetical protein